MNIRQKLRFGVDFAMSVVMFALMSSQYTGMESHEIAGAVMLALFLAHHALNLRWYKMLGRGSYSGKRILLTATDFILLADMLVLMVSGIAMSRSVFRFLGFEMEHELASSLHMVSGYLGFLLMGFHFGLHYGGILEILRKKFCVTKKNKARTWILQITAGAASGYGIYALIKQRFFDYIMLRAHFVLFDFDEPVILYGMNLLAIEILNSEFILIWKTGRSITD
ncbi:MAG: DUF4405 domain-containing protein [Clostridiaceae bacterium]|nr:DUF4405 domain-containing protein [Clostridiaceae bacterium]